MKDLKKLYTTALFYEALEGVCVADEDAACNLYKEGKYFEGLPYFKIFKKIHSIPDIDVSPAGGNLLKEMQLYTEYEKAIQRNSRRMDNLQQSLMTIIGNCSIN